MKVIYISTYADPQPLHGNNTSVAIAREVARAGHRVEIVTVTNDATWRGPKPDARTPRFRGVPDLAVEREGISYHVLEPPARWLDRTPPAEDWNEAVSWCADFLRSLNPDLVHQWQWQFLPFAMEAAISIGVPAVYSPYDFGFACLRTLLVTGEGTLCDATFGADKCASCVVSGRGALGRLNEAVASLPYAPQLLDRLYGDGKGFFARREGVRWPARTRTGLTEQRCQRVFRNIDAVTVTSEFAARFFSQFGLSSDRAFLMPWFHDHDHDHAGVERDRAREQLVVGYVGRISPEKGVDILLEALAGVRASREVVLRIAGSGQSRYEDELRNRFLTKAGAHAVEWQPWLGKDELQRFYGECDVVAVPSRCYETGPRTLIEALAAKVPVICTDLPPMNEFVRDGVNGFVFPFEDEATLRAIIERIAAAPEMLDALRANIAAVPSVGDAANTVRAVYDVVMQRRRQQVPA
jgi:glycosyltransferase involved in cell wall biosynthesis